MKANRRPAGGRGAVPPAAELTSGWRGNCGEALRGMGRVGTLAHGKQSAYLYQGAHARFTKFKTKLVFTFGIYLFVWRHQVASWLRDDFKAPLDPGHQVLSMFIPIYGLIVLWRFLQTIKATQLQTGMVSAISPARAFWWSSLWFSAGPYTNGQLNALATFAQGKASPTLAAPVRWPRCRLGADPTTTDNALPVGGAFSARERAAK